MRRAFSLSRYLSTLTVKHFFAGSPTSRAQATGTLRATDHDPAGACPATPVGGRGARVATRPAEVPRELAGVRHPLKSLAMLYTSRCRGKGGCVRYGYP